MIVINDLHISANRVAGSTPASAAALKQYTLDNLSKFLDTVNEPLIIVGDIFDSWQVPLSDVLATYKLFDTWMQKGHQLTVQCANHDLATDSAKMGSLQFLMALLPEAQFVINEGARVNSTMYCVPHAASQDLFDYELSKVPKCEVLFLHANLMNPFAEKVDHSLNVSREQLEALPAKLVYFGHEHHAREVGKAFVGGVQWPTSVSDCMDGKDKFAYRLVGTELTPIKTWLSTNYAELDWRNPTPSDAQFIRFVGHCKPEEAADMADVIARYRRTSEAFVVANAVKVGEDDEGGKLKLDSLEAITKFNVMAALGDYLTKDEMKTLENLK